MQAWIQSHQTLKYIQIIHIKTMSNMYLQQTHSNIPLTTTMPSMESELQNKNNTEWSRCQLTLSRVGLLAV